MSIISILPYCMYKPAIVSIVSRRRPHGGYKRSPLYTILGVYFILVYCYSILQSRK